MIYCDHCKQIYGQHLDFCPFCTSARVAEAPESTLDEAKRLVDGARGGAYGHPLDDFDALGRMWGAILTRWQEGVGGGLSIPDLPAETVALMLAAIKINREAARARRDNVVDLIGYAYTLELIDKKRRHGA